MKKPEAGINEKSLRRKHKNENVCSGNKLRKNLTKMKLESAGSSDRSGPELHALGARTQFLVDATRAFLDMSKPPRLVEPPFGMIIRYECAD